MKFSIWFFQNRRIWGSPFRSLEPDNSSKKNSESFWSKERNPLYTTFGILVSMPLERMLFESTPKKFDLFNMIEDCSPDERKIFMSSAMSAAIVYLSAIFLLRAFKQIRSISTGIEELICLGGLTSPFLICCNNVTTDSALNGCFWVIIS